MEEFVIATNDCLRHETKAFCHSDYHGGGNWKIQGTVENMICTIKNHPDPYPESVLNAATMRLSAILADDLPRILQATRLQSLRVCVIARSKKEAFYAPNQKLFRATIQQTIRTLNGFEDGTFDIIRHTNTKTTHLSRSGRGGDGPMPYCGITKDTCTISNNVYGKNILLIDDLYTRTVNIDEDAIQALYDNGAKSVIFYAIGKTIFRGY